MTNRLADETSPYLRQHADNPVDWYPWGDDAFAAGAGRGQADPAVGRVLVVPLVPRDGPRVLRGRRRRRGDERPVREREGRPRGAARRRRDLHGGGAGAHRPRRLADDRVPHPRRASPSSAAPTSRRTPARAARVRAAARRDRRRLAATGATTSSTRPSSSATRSRRAHARATRLDGRRASSPPAVLDQAGDALARAVRPAVRRVRAGAEVPAGDGARLPAPARACATGVAGPLDDGHHDARRDGRGRDLRPRRRRVRPLLDRRALARPPLREDALRPGAARAGVPPRVTS